MIRGPPRSRQCGSSTASDVYMREVCVCVCVCACLCLCACLLFRMSVVCVSALACACLCLFVCLVVCVLSVLLRSAIRLKSSTGV